MNEPRIDRWARALSDPASRRQIVLASFLGGLVLLRGGHGAVAKKKRKKRRKRKKNKAKITFNEFGCVNVGDVCTTREQCCSSICQVIEGKATCQAHDESTCQADQDACASGELEMCTTSAGALGVCTHTTGNAPYCKAVGRCFPCAKDVDCVPFCGPQAACVICEGDCGPNGTACFGTGPAKCTFLPA